MESENIKEPTDSEVRQVMIDGGKQLCEYAINKWLSGSYDPCPAKQENIARWKNIKSRINKNMFEGKELWKSK